jgi:hypothetical protein
MRVLVTRKEVGAMFIVSSQGTSSKEKSPSSKDPRKSELLVFYLNIFCFSGFPVRSISSLFSKRGLKLLGGEI